MQATKQEKTDLYRLMYRIRTFEEQSFVSFNKGLTHGVLHLCIGQEASAAGCIYDLKKEDYLATTHRGHGHVIAKGADLKRMFAELLGKETGYCRGRGGSMHIADMEIGILGANGIVGGGVPIAVGAGRAGDAGRVDGRCLSARAGRVALGGRADPGKLAARRPRRQRPQDQAVRRAGCAAGRVP